MAQEHKVERRDELCPSMKPAHQKPCNTKPCAPEGLLYFHIFKFLFNFLFFR